MAHPKTIHDWLLYLGTVAIALAKVERTIYYANNHVENDAEHSLHLAISATEVAAQCYPTLDTGLIAQFSIVHDLVEIYAGDVPTFDLTPQQHKQKQRAEKAAHNRLLSELPSHTAEMLRRYEAQKEPEAKLVRLVDKLLPAVIHAVAADANRDFFIAKFSIKSPGQVDTRNQRLDAQLRAEFPEFDTVLIAQRLLIKTARDRLWPPSHTSQQ